MIKISNLDKLKLEKHYAIVLVMAEGFSGKDIGFYVKTTKNNIDKISRMENISRDELQKLGEIVAEFEGITPPHEMEKYIRSLLN